MKFKLMVHQPNFSEEELIINPRDYGGLQVGHIVEIYHPEDAFSRLLLRVNKLSTDFQQKDTISIDQTVASIFQLRAYLDVHVNRIEAPEVTLDSVEIVFKDQYLSRSDMWRIQNSLTGSCVYMGKKVIFSGLRLQVNELWVSGEKLACGVIGTDTKVGFLGISSFKTFAPLRVLFVKGDVYSFPQECRASCAGSSQCRRKQAKMGGK